MNSILSWVTIMWMLASLYGARTTWRGERDRAEEDREQSATDWQALASRPSRPSKRQVGVDRQRGGGTEGTQEPSMGKGGMAVIDGSGPTTVSLLDQMAI